MDNRYLRGLVVMALLGLLVVGLTISGPAAAQGGTCSRNGAIRQLIVSPEHPPILYLLYYQRVGDVTSGQSFAWGLFRSDNSGANWSRLPLVGLAGLQEPRALAMDYRHPNVLYLALDDANGFTQRLYRSSDRGQTWTPVGDPIPIGGHFPGRITALAVDFLDSNVLYAGRYVDCSGPCGGFFRSRDGGLTWEAFDNTVGIGKRQEVRTILIDPNAPDRFYAETVHTYRYLDVMLFYGDREGNWQQLPDVPTGEPGGLAFDPTSGVLYTGTWRATFNPPAPPVHLWRMDHPELAPVGGATWQMVKAWESGNWCWGGVGTRMVAPLAVGGPGTTIFVGLEIADTSLVKTADQERTWTPVPLPPPVNMPATDPGYRWTAPATGHTVSGQWLAFLRAHGDTDNLGYPRTEVIADPMMGGQTVQYFQRLILEWHPENPPQYRIQRRLLGDILYPGADPPHPITDPPPGPWHYFPFSPGAPTGLGHFVANYTRSGVAIYFKDYFDSHGGVDAFGYPKEEPKLRDGMWTQRFQAAVFEYHPEFDRDGTIPGTNIPWRHYRVLLELLGDKYIAQNYLPYQ